MASPLKHCRIALCSLSTASIGTFLSCAAFITMLPALTNVSLLAKAIDVPACIAASVGITPLKPTNACITISLEASAAAAIIPSSPQRISPVNFVFFLNSFQQASLLIATPLG